MRINEKEKKGYDRYFQLSEGGENSNEVLAMVVVMVVGAVVVRMRTSGWVTGLYNSPWWNCWNLWLDSWLSNPWDRGVMTLILHLVLDSLKGGKLVPPQAPPEFCTILREVLFLFRTV